MSGAESVLMLAGAHGVVADFEKVVTGVPVDESGSETDLAPHAEAARPLAEKLLKFLKARAQENEELESQTQTQASAP